MTQTKRTAGIPRSRTGTAYGFFDYNADNEQLRLQIERFRQESNFSDRLELIIIGEEEREKLPTEIVSAARTIKAYGSVLLDCPQMQFSKMRKYNRSPVNAYELSHVVRAQQRRVHSTDNVTPLRGRSANFEVAGYLSEIMRRIGHTQYAKEVFKSAILYEDNQGIIQR